ncbi:hypothetical protein ACTWPT_22570 [Nonomuraea sp. 3N208]|uniref:hypothetical protein n=1 Tax=Nonomuraea sp. 3N208 TaxID=3457421 RepID=UPI003FCDCAD1
MAWVGPYSSIPSDIGLIGWPPLGRVDPLEGVQHGQGPIQEVLEAIVPGAQIGDESISGLAFERTAIDQANERDHVVGVLIAQSFELTPGSRLSDRGWMAGITLGGCAGSRLFLR